ncbi:MAG: LamG-like jellyroll fold domain-containing protein [Verrucomicrobiota bacterium]
MSQPPSNDYSNEPFATTLNALLSGDTSSALITQLNATLREDPAARRAYIAAMAMEAMLGREFAPLEETAAPEAPRRLRWSSLPALAAMAAALVLAATFFWRPVPGPGTPLPVAAEISDADVELTHAVITSLDEAGGRFRQVALSQGMRLGEGMLELDHGLAEITFDSGAEVTLEGPARLQLDSDNMANLAFGRASAHVPEPARGFVILTPSSYIRDLGTAFAVEVHDDHETDLHVLEGEVEVSATNPSVVNAPQILRQRQAVRLAAGRMVPINFRADHHTSRHQQRNTTIPPSVHWSFDSWDTPTPTPTTTDPSSGHWLKLQQKSSAALPTIIDGPFGQALHFDGHGGYARSDYPGVGGSQPRTIACWLRLQPNDASARPAPNGIIAWGVKRAAGKWQLAWNQARGQGRVGALRVEFGDGYVIGATDLRDGRWHHLAVVYLGGPKANVATHVRIYVDGHLESLTGRRQRRIDTDTTSAAARPLMLGRYLGQAPAGEAFFFEGDLDEVYVFEGTLLPGQIERLRKSNSLRQPLDL